MRCGHKFAHVMQLSCHDMCKLVTWLDHKIKEKRIHKILIMNLTHWGRMTHIWVGKLTTIGSDNGLSPGRRQVIIWTNAGILLIWPLRTNFNEISIGIQTFSFKKMHLKMASAKWRPFCLGLNVINCGWNGSQSCYPTTDRVCPSWLWTQCPWSLG